MDHPLGHGVNMFEKFRGLLNVQAERITTLTRMLKVAAKNLGYTELRITHSRYRKLVLLRK